MPSATELLPVTVPTAPLADLAERINAAHQQCEQALKAGLAHALEAGRLLLEAKGQVEHGQWLPWVEANCRFSERTAQAYMRVVRSLPELEAKAQGLADLTFEQSVELLASPCQDDERPEDPFVLTATGLQMVREPTLEEFKSMMALLGQLARAFGHD